MELVVMKFGGTSVGSAERIRSAAEIVRSRSSQYHIVVIVSALSGVTDLILHAVAAAQSADDAAMRAHLQEFEQHHETVVGELFGGPVRAKVQEQIRPVIRQFREFCSALFMLRATTPQILDVALPIGEKIAAHIFAAALRQFGVAGEFLDSARVLVTDDHFGDASADDEATERHCRENLVPLLDCGVVPVVMGYSGATPDGRPTTLGRGGSDSTATIIGAALKCREVWIWTDVDGVLTADPRICPDAHLLTEISFAEAIELSYYGAKVIHHKAIRPTMQAGIPVCIKNSFRPEMPGTRIQAHAARGDSCVKAVTAVSPAALVTLTPRRDIHFAEIFGRLLMRLGHEHVDILFLTQSSSENSLGLVLRASDTDRIFAAMCKLFRMELKHGALRPITIQSDIAVVAVLGEAMRGISGVIGRLFSAVARTNQSVIAVAQGASEINICFAVKASGVEEVIRAVHDEFISPAATRDAAINSA